MKNAHVLMRKARCVLLLTAMSSCSLLNAQQNPTKPVIVLRDLELGMPRDQVLAGLASHYKLTEASKSADASKGADLWQVFSGDTYAGDVWFNDGKLALATVVLHYAEHDTKERELVEKLFTTLFESSGKSSMDEGLVTRTAARSARMSVECEERSMGEIKDKILRFRVPPGDSSPAQRVFELESSKSKDGKVDFVMLSESILKEWRGQTLPRQR